MNTLNVHTLASVLALQSFFISICEEAVASSRSVTRGPMPLAEDQINELHISRFHILCKHTISMSMLYLPSMLLGHEG